MRKYEEQLFTLAEVSSFIVHFEICVVKTFKLDFQHHSNKKTGQQTYCRKESCPMGECGGGRGSECTLFPALASMSFYQLRLRYDCWCLFLVQGVFFTVPP